MIEPSPGTPRLRAAAKSDPDFFAITPASVRLTGKGKARFARKKRAAKRKSTKVRSSVCVAWDLSVITDYSLR